MCKLYKKRISVEEPRVGEEDRKCCEPELMCVFCFFFNLVNV